MPITNNDRFIDHVKRWLDEPLPAHLMADLSDILEDEDFTPEQRAHLVVWQAMKWMMENPIESNEQD